MIIISTATLIRSLMRLGKIFCSFVCLLVLTTNNSYASIIVHPIADTITDLDVIVFVSTPDSRDLGNDIVPQLNFWDLQIQHRKNGLLVADDSFFGVVNHRKHPRTGGPPLGPPFEFTFDNWYPIVSDPNNPGSFFTERTGTIESSKLPHPPIPGIDVDVYKVVLETRAELPIEIIPVNPPIAVANYLSWSVRVKGRHIPEPPSSALIGIGTIGLLLLKRRKRADKKMNTTKRGRLCLR